MRFGKTLTALEVVRRMQCRKVIIVTHRPVVSDGWGTDFKKIFYPGSSEHDYSFVCKTTDSAYVFDEKTDSENDLKIRKLDADGTYFIYFILNSFYIFSYITINIFHRTSFFLSL